MNECMIEACIEDIFPGKRDPGIGKGSLPQR
jgi:hypothetical protein